MDWYKILTSGKSVIIHKKGEFCGAIFYLTGGKIKAYNHELGECDNGKTPEELNKHIDSLMAENFNISILNNKAEGMSLI